jgi:WD40 repeat protein
VAHDVVTGIARPSFSVDSRMVAVVACSSAEAPSVVRIHLVSDGSSVRELTINDGEIWGTAFSPDGKYCAVSGEQSDNRESGLVRVFYIKDGKTKAAIDVEETWGVTSVAFTPDGKSIAAGTSNGEVLLYSLDPPLPPNAI